MNSSWTTVLIGLMVVLVSVWDFKASGRAASADTGRYRWAFRCGQLVCVTNIVVWSFYIGRMVVGGLPPAFSSRPTIVAVMTIMSCVAMLLVMPPSRDRWTRSRIVFETVAMSSALALAVWNIALRDVIWVSERSGSEKLMVVAGALGSLLWLVTVAVAVEKSRDPQRRPQLKSFTYIGVACSVAVSVEFLMWRHFLTGEAMPPQVGAGAWLLAMIAALMAARAWVPLPATQVSEHRTHIGSGLPYAVIAGAFVVCLPMVVVQRELDAVSTVIGTILVCGMLGRQYVMLRENTRLARELSRRVDARTAEVTAREHFRVLVQNSSDVVMAVSDEMVVTYASASVTKLLGKPVHHVIGMSLESLASEEMTELLDAFEVAKHNGGRPVQVEWSITRSTGGRVFIESLIAHLPDEPSVKGFVLNSRDVTDRRRLEQQLSHQAFHDALTGLPNRSLFKDRLQQALSRFERQGHRFAVLFCDLDSFKAVNDSVGHGLGDRLLVEVADRLRRSVRAGDTVARFGGDEFAILLEEISDEEITAASERVTQAIEEPFQLGNEEVFVGTSVGVVVSDSDANSTVDDLLRNADLAMYVAKALGKNRYVRFEPSMHDRFLDEIEMKNDLRRAVLNEEMILHYQPILELEEQHMIGVEALVRWQHPTRGLVPPNDFIPLCEETGMIVELGRWVLERSCLQLATWQRLYPENAPQYVSVNVSGRQLQDGNLVETVEKALRDTKLRPDQLTLEVTESVLLEDVTGVLAQLAALRELGVRLAIDDFGTGYSSLNYLRHFPIDMLKIDRSFVSGIGNVDKDSLLAKAITTLGRMLELKTVAEGVESPEELAELKAIGCDMAQGYLFARPVDSEGIDKMLESAPTRSLKL